MKQNEAKFKVIKANLGKHVKAYRVDSLLVDDDEGVFAVFADLPLELDDLHASLVDELPL